MNVQVIAFNILHEENACTWAEIIDLTNQLVEITRGNGCMTLVDADNDMLADRSARTADALTAALTRRDHMVLTRTALRIRFPQPTVCENRA
jgi:hypothetical protein